MNKIKQRRKEGAVCPKCKSPDYKYLGQGYDQWSKHEFECNSCKNNWQYGKSESIFTKLA